MKTTILKSALIAVIAMMVSTNGVFAKSDKDRQLYEWRYYTLNENKEAQMDEFLRDVLIPAYERQGVKTGAFTHAIDSLTVKQREAFVGKPTQRIVLFVYEDFEMYKEVKEKIWNDKKYRKAAQSFFDASTQEHVYSNLESYLCEAFEKFPEMEKPAKGEHLFELRTYWSPNEEANERKIAMFNNDEMKVFNQAKLHDLCYGKVLAGPRMPALIYLTSYKDLESRAEAWANFRANELWQKIKVLPQYKYTAVKNRVELIISLPYSSL